MLVPGAGKWRHRSAFGCRTPAFGVNPLGTPVKGAFGRSRSHHREQTWRVQEHTAGGFPRTGAGGRRTPGPAPRNRRPPERDRRRNGRDTGGGPPRTVRPPGRPATQWQTTSVLTAAMLVYALGAGITAAAGNRLALQLLLITVFGLHPFQVPLVKKTSGIAAVRRCLADCVCIGQFARLLPTLVVVAVSQAPSPESNPDSPLPVKATGVHDTTVQADRSEVRAIKPRLWPVDRATETLPAQPSQEGPAWVNHNTLSVEGRWSSYRLGAIHHHPVRGRAGTAWIQVCTVADLSERVLATRFWRMSNWAPMGRRCQPHSIAEMTADVRSHSQTHC